MGLTNCFKGSLRIPWNISDTKSKQLTMLSMEPQSSGLLTLWVSTMSSRQRLQKVCWHGRTREVEPSWSRHTEHSRASLRSMCSILMHCTDCLTSPSCCEKKAEHQASAHTQDIHGEGLPVLPANTVPNHYHHHILACTHTTQTAFTEVVLWMTFEESRLLVSELRREVSHRRVKTVLPRR